MLGPSCKEKKVRASRRLLQAPVWLLVFLQQLHRPVGRDRLVEIILHHAHGAGAAAREAFGVRRGSHLHIQHLSCAHHA